MKLILFSGFLGAGKTTAVLSASRYLLLKMHAEGVDMESRERVPLVILENEIGEIAYDEALLRSGGLEVRNLLSGCICCTLTVDLILELREIRDKYNPEYVIFEPSGAAFPDRILDTVSRSGVEPEWSLVVTIVDAHRFPKLMKVIPHLIEKQIAGANAVLISKTDLIGPQETDQVLNEVKRINEKARVYISPYGCPDADALWEEVFDKR